MKEIEKLFKKIINKTLNKIYTFNFFKRTQIIGFSWEFGFMMYLMGGATIVYPIVSYLFTIVLFDFSFLSVWSLIIFFFSFFLSGIVFGFRISISEKFLIFYPTIFFIPYNRLKVRLSNVNFKEADLGNKSNEVCIYHDKDDWCEMGFCDWITIKNLKKCYEIGGNDNYKFLLRVITNDVKSKIDKSYTRLK